MNPITACSTPQHYHYLLAPTTLTLDALHCAICSGVLKITSCSSREAAYNAVKLVLVGKPKGVHVAQWAKRPPLKQEVPGTNPVVGSTVALGIATPYAGLDGVGAVM
jgi:hypothetical protein